MKAPTSKKNAAPTHGSARLSPDFKFPANFEQVRRRAEAIYQSRGGLDGMTLNDWLKAELELKQELAETIAKNSVQNYENDQF